MANYDKNSQHFFTPDGRIFPEELLSLEFMFDQNASIDETEIKLEMKQRALLRKVCWVKIISYPAEVLLNYLFLGKGWAKERIAQHKIYKEFLWPKKTVAYDGYVWKKKISIVEFNNLLLSTSDKYLKEKSPK